MNLAAPTNFQFASDAAIFTLTFLLTFIMNTFLKLLRGQLVFRIFVRKWSFGILFLNSRKERPPALYVALYLINSIPRPQGTCWGPRHWQLWTLFVWFLSKTKNPDPIWPTPRTQWFRICHCTTKAITMGAWKKNGRCVDLARAILHRPPLKQTGKMLSY